MCIINKMICMWINSGRKARLLQKLLTPKGAVYISLVIIVIALLDYKSIAGTPYVDPKSYPTVAADWINENLDVENIRLFNDFNYGSYLLFKDIPVFIDGRADVYDPQFNELENDSFLDYMQAGSSQATFKNVLEKYQITHAITTADSQFNQYLESNENYTLLYNDGAFVIYEV